MKEFIEKLIGRLEELEKKLLDKNTGFECTMGIVNAMEHTKRIVNQLAEEHNNDFCEWEWGIDYAHVQCKGDRILFGSRRLFSYCPYCGKKIKVVE